MKGIFCSPSKPINRHCVAVNSQISSNPYGSNNSDPIDFMANMRRMGEPFIQGYETILSSENSRLFEMKYLTSSDYCVDK